jgi:hypothetical protein
MILFILGELRSNVCANLSIQRFLSIFNLLKSAFLHKHRNHLLEYFQNKVILYQQKMNNLNDDKKKWDKNKYQNDD